jgi:hypothetical protein
MDGLAMRELLERVFSGIAAGAILREPIACAADELPLDGAGELRAEHVGNALHLYCVDSGPGSIPFWAAFVVGWRFRSCVARRLNRSLSAGSIAGWGLAAVVGRHMLAMGRGLAASIAPIAGIVVAPTLFLDPVMRSGVLICPRSVANHRKFTPKVRSWEDATSGEMS